MNINIGIGINERKEICGALSKLLADSYTLYLKTHNFHWNVEGPMFNTLHVMFMEQYTEMWTALDLIAERIRALGHYAPGSYKQFAALTSIEESDTVPSSSVAMLEQLLNGHEAVARTARAAFPTAENGNDEGTLDLLTQRIQLHEKTAWMLRSMLAKGH